MFSPYFACLRQIRLPQFPCFTFSASARPPYQLDNHSMKSARFIISISAFVFGFLGMAPTAQAFVTANPNLPPLGGAYQSPNVFAVYGGPALQFTLSIPQHMAIAIQSILPQGPDEVETYFSTFDANLQVTQNGLTVQNGPIQANGQTITITRAKIGNVTGSFQTEMLALNLSGGTLPPGMMVRESPTLLSLGQTSITDIGGGLYQIDSFFDVFTELSLDGGGSWIPNDGGPTHVELQQLASVPEPGTMGLLIFGTSGLVLSRLRRRS